MTTLKKPLIVGIGGTARPASSSECALRLCLAAAERNGAEVMQFSGSDIMLPIYDPGLPDRTPEAQKLLAALRDCDGVVLASPGYHGSMSGLIKNVLDYVEDLRSDRRPYFDARAVGLIVCAYGWQATGTTLTAMRSVVHALRGWPTPMGVGINSALKVFDGEGNCEDESVGAQLVLLAGQVVDFAKRGSGRESQ